MDTIKQLKNGNILVDGKEYGEVKKEVKEEVKKEVKSYKRWRAKEKGKYFYIDAEGKSGNYSDEEDNEDNYNYKIGNYYKTKEQAEKTRDRQLLIVKLNDIIKEQNGEWVEKWDGKQGNYFILRYENRVLWKLYDLTYRNLRILNYMSKETVNYLLENHKEDLEILFSNK